MKSLPELVTDQDIREMFDTADDDGDGLIDIEEFGRMVIYVLVIFMFFYRNMLHLHLCL